MIVFLSCVTRLANPPGRSTTNNLWLVFKKMISYKKRAVSNNGGLSRQGLFLGYVVVDDWEGPWLLSKKNLGRKIRFCGHLSSSLLAFPGCRGEALLRRMANG